MTETSIHRTNKTESYYSFLTVTDPISVNPFKIEQLNNRWLCADTDVLLGLGVTAVCGVLA